MFSIFNRNNKKNKKNNHSIEDENIDDPGTTCQSSSCELKGYITGALSGTYINIILK